MATITKIEIDGFKAFPEKFVLNLDGKNLLLYGENGSGKSSIYYALHAMFQSVLKEDKGAKYFKIEEGQHLINTNRIEEVTANTYQPSIRITFNNGNVWRLDRGGLVSESGSPKDEIILLNRGSAFINHSYISRFHAARNSEEINLWNVFYKDILPFYQAKMNEDFLSVIFDNLKHEADEHPRMSKKSFLKRIDVFNEKLSHFIEDINKRVNDLYNDNFRFEDDPKLNIRLLYMADDAPENTNKEWYYLFYGTERNGQRRYPRSLDIPQIGLHIEENGKPINKPQAYFNEARLTAIALAVRFACLSRHSDGCFLALDDMLISLDMSNRMQVIRYLLNNAIKDRHLYIFTHDRLFFHTFKRTIETQYCPADWRFGGLYSNDLGDYLTPEYKAFSKDKITDVDEAYQRHDYFLCGILLRKKLEDILSEVLPESFRKKQDSQTKLTIDKKLDEQIASLKEFCEKEEINYEPFKNLKAYKDLFLNSTAHNDLSSPFYRREIKACRNAIKALSRIKRAKKILEGGKDISFVVTSSQRHIVRVRLREPLLLLEDDGDIRLSYFSKCEVRTVIHEDGRQEEIEEGFESIYKVYRMYCEKYKVNIPLTVNLLDIFYDRGNIKLRNKL